MNKRFLQCLIAPSMFWTAGIRIEKDLEERIISILILFGAISSPLFTAGFHRGRLDLLKYLIISHLIFYLASMGYWFNDQVTPTIFMGTFAGSLLFQYATKYIFKVKISWKMMLLISFLSVMTFIPFQLNWSYNKLGFAVFLWMIINSFPLNYKSKN